MQVNDDYMDEIFTRKLGNMEATPPDDGWHRIENELDRRSRSTRRFWLAAASFALLLSVTASVIYLQTNSSTSDQGIATVVGENVPKQHTQQTAPDNAGNVVATSEGSRSLPEEQRIRVQNETVHQNETVTTISQASRLDETTGVAVISTVEPHSSQGGIVTTSQPIEGVTQSNTSVYVDSWDEMMRLRPLKANRLELISKKATLQRPEAIADASTTVVPPTLPQYDDFAFVDVTNVTTKAKPKNRWEITGQFAPVYSFRAITNVPNGMNKSDFDDAESGLMAYSGGITVAYKIAGRVSVQTGVFYSQMGQSINSVIPVNNMYVTVSSNNAYPKNFVRTSTGSVTVGSNMKADVNTTYASYFNTESQPSNSKNVGNALAANASKPVKYNLIERIDYLEIPVMLRYIVVDRKLNLYVLGGMSTNILIDNNVFVDNGSDLTKEGNILMARPVNYSGTFGFGLSYRITGNLLIDIEPSFKYYLLPYTTNSQISTNPYALGLFTGVIYRF